jgi:trigger factor
MIFSDCDDFPTERQKNVEMNVSVVDLSANQKKLHVEIPADKVRKELEAKYRDLSKQVRIKGFRPGKVPRSILKSYYGKTVEHEVSSQFIQDTFSEALREADLHPLVQADVSETRFDDNGAFVYVAVVDVSPPFEVEGYKGLEVQKSPVKIDEDQVQAELERIREQNAQLLLVEEDRAIQEGDVVLTDFVPSLDGKVFEKGKTEDFMVEVGKHAIHPEFDGHLIGHHAGESVSFELDYPEDTPTPEIRGKRVHFDVQIKEIKKKELPELNDELARTVKFDTLDALKESIRERLRKREEERISVEVRQQITDQLLSKVQLDLSSKVIEREVDRLIDLLKNQFESQGLKIDTSRFNTPEIRGEYRPQAVRNLSQRLIFQQIAKQENIELTDEDLEEIYRGIALYARMDVEKVKAEYADSSLVEQAKEGKIQEKVLKLLEETAVYKELPDEGVNTNTD